MSTQIIRLRRHAYIQRAALKILIDITLVKAWLHGLRKLWHPPPGMASSTHTPKTTLGRHKITSFVCSIRLLGWNLMQPIYGKYMPARQRVAPINSRVRTTGPLRTPGHAYDGCWVWVAFRSRCIHMRPHFAQHVRLPKCLVRPQRARQYNKSKSQARSFRWLGLVLAAIYLDCKSTRGNGPKPSTKELNT